MDFPAKTDELGDPANSYEDITNYNNFYEFSTQKEAVNSISQDFTTEPWTVEVSGLVNNPKTYGIEDLLNELRNAGAEAIAVDGVRIVMGVVVAGAPGELSVENSPLGEAFEIRAIGSPQILTGTLTRIGGVIAQIGTTYPDATLTVTPVERLTLPATERSLVPSNAEPRL